MRGISGNRLAAVWMSAIILVSCAACTACGAGGTEGGSAETGSSAGAEGGAEMGSSAGAESDAEMGSSAGAESDAMKAGIGMEAEMETAEETRMEIETETEAETTAGTDAEESTETVAEMSAGTIAETGTGTAAETSAETEAEPVTEAAAAADGLAHMRVMAYNIYYKESELRKDNVFDVISRNDPDVLLLQEFSQEWLKYLPELLDHGYSCYGYGRRGDDILKTGDEQRDEFTPVLWKTDRYDLADSGYFYLSSTPDEPSATWTDGDRELTSKYVRCANWVILRDRDTGSEILVLPIHLAPESGQVRPNGCRLILEKLEELRGGRPAVIGGDFNIGPWDTCYTIMTEGGYADTRHAAAETTDSGTFNDFGKYLRYCDYIFASGDVKVDRFSVPDDMYDGMHASDHCPIVVDICFSAQTERQ